MSPDRRQRSRREKLAYRGKVPIGFQDPYGSLSPVYRVAHGVLRALKLHRPTLSGSAREQVAVELFRVCRACAWMGIPLQYHTSSAVGSGKGIGFAQALACNPELIPGRRAGINARRLCAHRGAQPHGHAAPGAAALIPLHHARHCEREVTSRIA